MITSQECRAARQARNAELERKAVARFVQATANTRLFRDRLKPDGFPPKPFVDVTALYAKDAERERMRADRELWPTGLGIGSGT